MPARLVVLALVLLVAVVPVARGAGGHLPAGYFGVSLNPAITDPGGVTDGQLDRQMALMASSGVRSVRVVLAWARINAKRGSYDWSSSDRIVRAAARHRLTLLPTVMLTPRWASRRPRAPFYTNFAPRKLSLYGRFLAAMVRRYGPHGTFFAAHRRIPQVPIHAWQVWNEPSQPFFWQTHPWYRTFVPMLRSAHRQVHAVDPHATVVTPGLAGGPDYEHGKPTGTFHASWVDVSDLYQAGGKGTFDAVAVNQYTNADGSRFTAGKPTGVADSVEHQFEVVAMNRQVIRRFHDRAALPIYLTEFGWPAAYGHLPDDVYQGQETTPAGEAERMRAFYGKAAANGRFSFAPDPGQPAQSLTVGSLGLRRTYYYTWASGFGGESEQTPFAYSGLVRWVPGSPFRRLPVLSTYRAIARAYGRR